MEAASKLSILIVFAATLITSFAFIPGKASADTPLTAGYTESYTFKINGKSIGTQSATLLKVENGDQTWKFSIDLMIPMNMQTISLKQSGTYVVDSDTSPLSYNAMFVTNGVTQSEQIAFTGSSATVAFDPAIPAVASSIPIVGKPCLLVNNLVSLISLATRATYAKQTGAYNIPMFSGNALRQVFCSLQPSTDATPAGGKYRVFVATMSTPGLPDNVNEYWLSSTNGELLRCVDKAQNLEITKD